MNFDGDPIASSKLSRNILRGRSVPQSVPSMTFRFNAASDNITQVTTDGDYKYSEHEGTEGCTEFLTSSQCSERLSLDRRSSSLDDVPVDASTVKSVTKRDDIIVGPPVGLFSRFSKTVEHKINNFKQDKFQKERDKACACIEDIKVNDENSSVDAESFVLPIQVNTAKENDSPVSKPTSISLSNSPSRKSSLVQDLAEFSTELGRSIPKLSELRNRKSYTKDSRSRSSFTLNSILGRDEGISLEILVPEECDSFIEHGVEAEEGILFSSPDAGTVSYIHHPESQESSQPSPDINENESLQDQLIHKEEKSYTSITRISKNDNLIAIFHGININFSNFTWFIIVICLSCFVSCLPSFLSGFIVGGCVAGVLCLALLKLFVPLPSTSSSAGQVHRSQHPVRHNIPSNEEHQHYKGWLNELSAEYCPENYHVSRTHSVYVRLHGTRLQLDHPRRKINKHCRFGENLQCGGFVHHREYDLRGATVLLMPRNLPRRWLWSRKYPICLRLAVRQHSAATSPSSGSSSFDGTPDHCVQTGVVSGTDASSNASCDVGPQLPEGSSEGASALEEGSSPTEDADLDSFEQITEAMCTETKLFLFARSDREKDDWFRRFVDAAAVVKESSPGLDAEFSSSTPCKGKPNDSKSSTEAVVTGCDGPEDFPSYMAHLLYPRLSAGGEVSCLNAIIGRLLYDFLHNPYWANKIQERVQRKLSKVHVPSIVGELIVCGVQLGGSVPQLRSVAAPRQDERGLWCDLSVEYEGNFTMTIETKLDLMKLKKSDSLVGRASVAATESITSAGSNNSKARCGAAPSYRTIARSASSHELLQRDMQFDTDTDDSVESSSEDDCGGDDDGFGVVGAGESPGLQGGGRRLMRLVDSVAGSRYFQQVTDWRLLQRAMKGVSNTRIVLSVTVERLCGTLTVNVPPQPSDRLWYGFTTPPDLVMLAQPRLGDRSVNLPFLADFIQKQLRIVFEKVFVLPNMDDLVVPVMSPLLPGQTQMPKPPWDLHTSAAVSADVAPESAPGDVPQSSAHILSSS